MNGYELTRNWFDFKFENSQRIKASHSEFYFYLVDKWNRIGQKSEFGLPTAYTMEALGIASYNTYKKILDDLVEYGFVVIVQNSSNQHQSKIVALSNSDKATDKPLDKAVDKALDKATDKPLDTIIECIRTNKNNEIIQNSKTIIQSKLNFEDFGFFEPLIHRWLDYKKSQHNEKYKSQDTLNTFVKKLIELSNGQFEIAEKIIEASIANGYKGIFTLKTGNGFNQQKPDKFESLLTQYDIAINLINSQKNETTSNN